MGCYSKWFEYGFSDPATFRAQLGEQFAKFASLKHIIDYYVAVARKQLPRAAYSGHGCQYDLMGRDELSDADYAAICRHLACDEVHYSVLLDVETILNQKNPEACRYAYVLMQCMVRLRSERSVYYPSNKVALESIQQLNEGAWFVEEPH